jgi:predicted transcriptional regulator
VIGVGMGEDSRLTSGAYKEIELIERHIKMLRITRENQPVGIIRLSEILELPRHKVRYSLRMLERDGVIVATPDGAVVSERYECFMREMSEYLRELKERIEEVRAQIPGT